MHIKTNKYVISCHRNLQNLFGLSYVMNSVKDSTTMGLEVRKKKLIVNIVKNATYYVQMW